MRLPFHIPCDHLAGVGGVGAVGSAGAPVPSFVDAILARRGAARAVRPTRAAVPVTARKASTHAQQAHHHAPPPPQPAQPLPASPPPPPAGAASPSTLNGPSPVVYGAPQPRHGGAPYAAAPAGATTSPPPVTGLTRGDIAGSKTPALTERLLGDLAALGSRVSAEAPQLSYAVRQLDAMVGEVVSRWRRATALAMDAIGTMEEELGRRTEAARDLAARLADKDAEAASVHAERAALRARVEALEAALRGEAPPPAAAPPTASTRIATTAPPPPVTYGVHAA